MSYPAVISLLARAIILVEDNQVDVRLYERYAYNLM